MKIAKYLPLGFLIILIACDTTQPENATDKIKSFILGTYIRTFEGEYSQGNDTLMIYQPNPDNNYYVIQHSVGYQKKSGGLFLPLKFKNETWIATFNEQTNVLEEKKAGKMISFLPDQKTLLLGNSEFKKLISKK